MTDSSLRLVPILALAVSPFALAQPERTDAVDAADAKASAPALRYHSAFADYKPWQHVEPGDWRELNDAVAPSPGKPAGQAGRGSSAPPGPAAKAFAPAAPLRPPHHMHGGKP